MSQSCIQVSRRSLCHHSLSMYPKTKSGGSSPRSSELLTLFTTDWLAKVFTHKTSLNLRRPAGARFPDYRRGSLSTSLGAFPGSAGGRRGLKPESQEHWPVGDIQGRGGQGEGGRGRRSTVGNQERTLEASGDVQEENSKQGLRQSSPGCTGVNGTLQPRGSEWAALSTLRPLAPFALTA